MKKINPWQWLILSFLFLIGLGTLLLKMPWVKHASGLSFIDALFTSTSAVCVTGLTTVPTSGFNLWGQITILLLIQLGAVGIMTLTTSFLLMLKGSVGLRYAYHFAQVNQTFNLYDARLILKRILFMTFGIETLGFIGITIGFLIQGFPLSNAMYYGFFHAISAFGNAGFSPFDNSLINTQPTVKIFTALMIMLGGLGYFVLYDLYKSLKKHKKLSLHSKVVLLTSVVLWIGGMLFFMIFEKFNISPLDSFFLSVTARTAGFTSVPLSGLSYASIILLYMLMFIGASPGSTGGGIKTTHAFVIFSSVLSLLKGKTQVVVFNRSIPLRFILKAFATTFLFTLLIVFSLTLLLETHHFSLESSLFEVISALGTVGLSLGATTQLGFTGKLIIILLMFLGRVGPASLALAILQKQKEVKIKYPEEEIF